MNPNIPIKEIMTTDLTTVKNSDSVKHIRALFERNNFHHLLVLDSLGKLSGIISKEDFYKFTYTLSMQTTGRTWSKHQYESIVAADIMTESPFVLDPDDTIGLAADLFLANRFHALPVVEVDSLLGILTSHDLLKHCFKSPVAPQESEPFNEVKS